MRSQLNVKRGALTLAIKKVPQVLVSEILKKEALSLIVIENFVVFFGLILN